MLVFLSFFRYHYRLPPRIDTKTSFLPYITILQRGRRYVCRSIPGTAFLVPIRRIISALHVCLVIPVRKASIDEDVYPWREHAIVVLLEFRSELTSKTYCNNENNHSTLLRPVSINCEQLHKSKKFLLNRAINRFRRHIFPAWKSRFCRSLLATPNLNSIRLGRIHPVSRYMKHEN